ncbi:hypothetical protein J4403_01400 [Candidatus Woesearchaeota archaeon]|nr:hypothetical protein [Candidatus Woesearchaeota archaeon]
MKDLTIKELAQKDTQFISGHRACAGCAFPIIVKTILASTDKKVVVCAATGCLEVVSTIYPYSSWKVPFIHSAFENAGATISGVETAFKALKKKDPKLKKEDVKFIAFAGDGGSYDIGLQSLSGTLERGHDIVFVVYDNEAYMNCLSLDSLIMTKEGLKKVMDVKVGELIYAFDENAHKLITKKCIGKFNNGIKKVYELNTFHHSIKTTDNHPFLILKRNGRGKKAQFIWKKLKDLKVGNEIITLKKINNEKSFSFDKIKISKKGDYKVNKINEINLPKISSTNLMEFLGLYMGDGWIRESKAEVGFALPRNKKGRERLITLYKKIFNISLKPKDKNYVYIYSLNLVRFIESLKFNKGAKNKIVPAWIFTLPLKEKEAFIQGLMLSDGYQIKNSKRYISASIDLLKTLRLLLQTCNYRVGKIHLQKKLKGTHVVYRKLLKDSTYGYICFSKKKRLLIDKYISQTKQKDFFAGNKNFGTEKIISIKFIKEESTIDLSVEGAHNFIADGIVVHNTGVQGSSSTPFGATTTTTPDGKIHHGKEQIKKNLMEIVIAHKIPYAAQASVFDLEDLSRKAKKAFETKGPSFLNVLSPCNLGWKHPPNITITIAKLATETNFWPLYEYENGNYILNYKPQIQKSVNSYLRLQGRFKHLFKPENNLLLEKLQKSTDEQWEKLLKVSKNLK